MRYCIFFRRLTPLSIATGVFFIAFASTKSICSTLELMISEKLYTNQGKIQFFKPTVKQEISKRSLSLLLENQILTWSPESQKFSDINLYVTAWTQTDEFIKKTYLKWCSDIEEKELEYKESIEWDSFWELSNVHGYISNVYELQLIRNYMEGAFLFIKSPQLFSSTRTLKRLSESLEFLINDIEWMDSLYEHCFYFIQTCKSAELRKQVELSLKMGLALKKYFYGERFTNLLEALRNALEQLPKKKQEGRLVASIEVSLDFWDELDKTKDRFSLMDNPNNNFVLDGSFVLKEFPWQQQEDIKPYDQFPQDKTILEASYKSAAKSKVLEQLKSKYTLAELENLLVLK
jgi:hypothetical protein